MRVNANYSKPIAVKAPRMRSFYLYDFNYVYNQVQINFRQSLGLIVHF